MTIRNQIAQLLNPLELKLFKKLSSPQKIQNYLDSLKINFEMQGSTYVETNMTPRAVMASQSAHCLEGAIFAAAVLAYHGQRPLLMDFRTIPVDEDHVIALFKQNGLWGAISKTNHSTLRWRDPIYRTTRELSLSYAHEYLLWNGKKSLIEYSAPFSLSRFDPKKWVIGREDLDWLPDALDNARHFPIAPKKNLELRRKADNIELRAMQLVEWKAPRGFIDRG